MPLKKRSSLSRNSRNVKKMRNARSQESSEERAHRLNSTRVNNATARAHESSSEREMRLTSDRERRARSRASETSSQQELRLTVDREWHVLSRESETFTKRHLRLTADRERNILSRESETATQRELRLKSDRERHVLSRESETYTERELRLTADRERHVLSRESETYTERELRLTADRERHVLSRESETYTERDLRLTADRERHVLSRESETYTERELRLTADRERHVLSRDSETYTERELRLTADRERHVLSRESETYTERELRLTADRERHVLSRDSETYTERELRLTADRERHVLSRESETYTERELRLTADRERHVFSRQSESSTQYHDRLTVDRIHHAITRSIEDEHDHDRRLESGREYYNSLRQEQTISLLNERQRIDNIRSQETDEQREARLSADRFRHIFGNLEAHTEDLDEPTNLLPWTNKYKSGFTYAATIDYNSYSKIGDMNVVCAYCNALKWSKESAGFCCSGGKINLPTFEDPPEPLKSLLLGEHTNSKHFLDNIRKFNSAFQMTSFGAQQISEGPFMPTFKIQGQVYHLIGSLLPADDPKFLQIYFVSDYNEQSIIRNQNFPNLNTELISELQHMLHQVNSYVCSFKSALEAFPRELDNNYKIVINADRRPTQEHIGRYNAPSTNEVAVVLVDQECDRRDIVIRSRDNGLQRIFETHRAYDSLQYPMIFCRGEDGYNFALYQTDSRTGAPNYNKKISCLQFYCYHLQVRQGKFLYLHRFRSLFNQFIVDMYAKIETERLVYIRSNQRQLRAEEYVHLRDAMQQDNNTVNMGRLVILPSSFTGGPRYMHERTQDAFCYVRKYGRPDLFITITTNPKWDEITNELLEGQASYDRHDIIARVFHLKLKLIINLLTKDEIFGEVLCFMYSVEWQKRGLPHAHILLWLKDKIRPNDVDSLINAEFPDPIADPELYDIIKTHMVHGPCGTLNANAPCMQNGRCTKRYPKALVDQTITGNDGYPLYRRRSKDYGGFTVEKRVLGQQITLDNRWVVPYSPILSRTFQAHINVEMCNSVESIKYICKYINKGSDQATFALRNEHDEITRFQSGRYISSSEAVWRILSFNIHERYPPVTHLDVHLEGGQRIYFNPENVTERLENPRQTTLLAYFRLCQTDVFAKTLLYEEVPSYYTYDKQRGSFNRRRRGRPVDGEPGIFKEHVLGRVYTVHPNNAECFYLRLLLHTVRGSTSFIDLRTVDGIVYPTYHAACQAYHLLENDQHWDHALAESCISDNPRRLRHLFVTLMAFCNLSDAAQLWEKYKEKLSEDFLQNISHNNEGATNDSSREIAINRCLLTIQEELTAVSGKLLSEYGMPTPNSVGECTNREYFAEISYNSVDLLEVLENGVSIMTPEQRSIYDRVCESVQNNMGTIWFLDAPGGTGKTFLTKLILAYVRHQRKIALAVASSGIAATLLPGGKTAHTMFKIPIDLNCTESPTCCISRNSDKAKVLLECNLIIWDECTMAHRKGVEAVDRTLKDIRQNDRPMGGVTVLFCGDFRQILPVIPRGTRADEIRACLKSSNLWRNIQSVHLTTNMRVRTGDNPDDNQFSDTLIKIGEGTYPQQHGGKVILSPALCCRVQSQQDLITSVYGDLSELFERDNNWLCERSILTPRNDQASDINSNILSNIQGETKIYYSINRMLDQQEATNYPIEFLNSLNMPGLPAHEIHLKIGIPIILLRNLRPPQLCNGTRLKVIQLQQNIIEAQILTGCGAGEIVFIPRIPIIPNNFPFEFKRTQFPVSVCYAMTINKAQGQTFRVAGVDLSLSCFSHGQLYVALSRVSSSRNLYAYIPEGSTLNIVYPEVLR